MNYGDQTNTEEPLFELGRPLKIALRMTAFGTWV